jgi:hypothetical protein
MCIRFLCVVTCLQLFDCTVVLLYRADLLQRVNDVKMKAVTSKNVPPERGTVTWLDHLDPVRRGGVSCWGTTAVSSVWPVFMPMPKRTRPFSSECRDGGPAQAVGRAAIAFAEACEAAT